MLLVSVILNQQARCPVQTIDYIFEEDVRLHTHFVPVHLFCVGSVRHLVGSMEVQSMGILLELLQPWCFVTAVKFNGCIGKISS